jgi:hypothetical protein
MILDNELENLWKKETLSFSHLPWNCERPVVRADIFAEILVRNLPDALQKCHLLGLHYKFGLKK